MDSKTRAAGLAFAIAVLMMAGCRAPASSVRTTASPSSGESAHATPTATPANTAAPAIGDGQLVEVVPHDLELQVAASTSAATVTLDDHDVVLQAGQKVLVLSDPTSADGLWWLRVAVDGTDRDSVLVGWVVAGTVDDARVTDATPSCPEPTLAMAGMTPLERFGCYRSQRITFTAYQASAVEGLGGACAFDAPAPPGWLMCDNINYNWVNSDGGTDWQFLLHFDPAVGIAPTGLAMGTTGPELTITGHFNDPAAGDCVTESDPTSDLAKAQRLSCAVKFVVEAWRPTG
jgi:hypothetical protein